MNTDSINNPEVQPSRRYWKAVIACLPAEKRDAAWEFYINTLSEGHGGDTLSGLILLLEAHGAFMLSLPEQLHEEMLAPVVDQIAQLRKEMASYVRKQQHAHQTITGTEATIVDTAKALQAARNDLGASIRRTVESIDVERLAIRVQNILDKSTITPIKTALLNFHDSNRALERTSNLAAQHVETWRRIQIGNIVLGILSLAVAITVTALTFLTKNIETKYEMRFAQHLEHFENNRDAFEQISKAGIRLHVKPWSGTRHGRTIIDARVIKVLNAEAVQTEQLEDRINGVVLVDVLKP